MSKEKYRELMDQLYKIAEIENDDSQYDACHLEVEGIAFTFAYREEQDINSLFVYCDFGEPPPEMRATVLKRLLESNYSLYGQDQPSFGFNSENKRVVLMYQFALEDLKAKALMDKLVKICMYAHTWREKYFLLNDEREMALLKD